MCDGETIWTQQGAMVKHVTKRKRSRLNQMFVLFSTDKRLLFKYSYLKAAVIVEWEFSAINQRGKKKKGERNRGRKEAHVLNSSCE